MSLPLPDAADGLALTQDTILGGRLRLAQPARGHRAGTDAVLLAAATRPTGGRLIDAGAGVGTAGLALALRDTTTHVVLLEREPTLAALARRNVIDNGLADRATIVEADLLSLDSRRRGGLQNESADTIVTNPPFYAIGRHRPSTNPLKRAAHVMEGTLESWLSACMALLRPGGRLVLIHRPDELTTVLGAISGRCGAITIRGVHARADETANRVLVTATKGSHAPLVLRAPLVMHEADGQFTEPAAALHGGLSEALT